MKKQHLLLVGLMIVYQTSALSFNQPKFCPMVSWNPSPITFLTNTTIGAYPSDLFISSTDILFIAGNKLFSLDISSKNSNFSRRDVPDHLLYSDNVFATFNGDVYFYSQHEESIDKDDVDTENLPSRRKRKAREKCIPCWYCIRQFFFVCTKWHCTCGHLIRCGDRCKDETGNNNNNNNNNGVSDNSNSSQNDIFGTIHRWSAHTNTTSAIVTINGSCADIFIDDNNTIYCSETSQHQIQKKSLDDNASSFEVVAGNGSYGFAPNMLHYPSGIFVSTNFSLYVADNYNHRIQFFSTGNHNGSTVAGSSDTIILLYPTGIVLDADQYLYITDYGNNRIVGSGPNGFRCLVGCTRKNDFESTKVFYPVSLSFDRYGNIFVLDGEGSRILKFLLATNSCDLSYNQPHFCSSAAWESEAITFANITNCGENSYGLLVDASNTVYEANAASNVIHVWSQEGGDEMKNISGDVTDPHSLFVTRAGAVFIDDGQHGQVHKWFRNEMTNVLITTDNASCYGLFVDLNDTIYCSMIERHQVVKHLFNDVNSTCEVAAGTGENGSEVFELNEPYGIFVHTNFSLYVADSLNNRIQRFEPNLENGNTVAGTNNTIELLAPTAVVLDADGYLFIVDKGNNRIVGSGSSGFRCIVGCSNQFISEQIPSFYPRTLSFDSYGNIFVLDTDNHRVLKFPFEASSCDLAVTSSSTGMVDTEAGITNSISASSPSPTHTTITAETAVTTSKPSFETIPSHHFVAPSCDASTSTSDLCAKLKSPCTIFKPCLNNGSCSDNDTSPTGYSCSCLSYYNGTECQYDYRPCKSNTCWNNGTCTVLHLNETFNCTCQHGWEGEHCEIMTNLCKNVTCMNGGICRPSFLNYTCECLTASYSGRHCEIVATSLIVYETVSKSFAYIAILALLTVVMFIVIMDVLKYGFKIDPVKEDREWIRRQKRLKMRRPVIQRFTYVNKSPSSPPVIPNSSTSNTTA